MTTMDAGAAAWVRKQVLPTHCHATLTDTCPCQWGPCGHCQQGNHLECPKRTNPRHGQPDPEAWIVDQRGLVAAHWATVWRAHGPACRWICRCDCPPELHPGLPPMRRQRRADLGIAGLNTTPRRLRGPEQDVLFEVAS